MGISKTGVNAVHVSLRDEDKGVFVVETEIWRDGIFLRLRSDDFRKGASRMELSVDMLDLALDALTRARSALRGTAL